MARRPIEPSYNKNGSTALSCIYICTYHGDPRSRKQQPSEARIKAAGRLWLLLLLLLHLLVVLLPFLWSRGRAGPCVLFMNCVDRSGMMRRMHACIADSAAPARGWTLNGRALWALGAPTTAPADSRPSVRSAC